MRALLLTLSAAATLGACASTGPAGPAPVTPLARFSLQVEPGVDRIALAVHDDGLSSNQQAAIQDLVNRYEVGGTGWIKVEGPSGDDPVSAQQTYAVRTALQQAGVPSEHIQLAGYYAPDPRAPVLVGFDTVRAVVPDCASVSRDMSGRFSNQGSTSLGCAINANMAAQIADPRDIVAPRLMTPADSGRAAVVFDHYRKGEATSAAREPLVEGRVSQAVE